MIGGSSRAVAATKKCNLDGVSVMCYDSEFVILDEWEYKLKLLIS